MLGLFYLFICFEFFLDLFLFLFVCSSKKASRGLTLTFVAE